MPLYMDIHKNVAGLTAEAVADAHRKDLETQGKHGGTRRTGSTQRTEKEDAMGKRTHAWALATALLVLVASACADDVVTPPSEGVEPPHAGAPAHLGLVEVTISGIGTETPSATAISASSVAALERLRAGRGATSVRPS